MTKHALGRGLQALIPDSRLQELEQEAHFIPIEQISSYPGQPRKFFHQDKIDGLAQSISQHGIIQPVVVTRALEGYQLVAGERRLRAAKAAGLREIPAIITSITEEKKLELSLIENIQREDLNPLEEALAFNSMVEDLGLTQEEIAQRMGKDRSTIANTLRLLKLPAEIKQHLVDQQLSMGHARAILALNSTSQQLSACRYIIKKALSVRDTERYVQQLLHPTPPKTSPQPDALIADLEERLKRKLATQVKISWSKNFQGRIRIEFYSAEELERLTSFILHGGENL